MCLERAQHCKRAKHRPEEGKEWSSHSATPLWRNAFWKTKQASKENPVANSLPFPVTGHRWSRHKSEIQMSDKNMQVPGLSSDKLCHYEVWRQDWFDSQLSKEFGCYLFLLPAALPISAFRILQHSASTTVRNNKQIWVLIRPKNKLVLKVRLRWGSLPSWSAAQRQPQWIAHGRKQAKDTPGGLNTAIQVPPHWSNHPVLLSIFYSSQNLLKSSTLRSVKAYFEIIIYFECDYFTHLA